MNKVGIEVLLSNVMESGSGCFQGLVNGQGKDYLCGMINLEESRKQHGPRGDSLLNIVNTRSSECANTESPPSEESVTALALVALCSGGCWHWPSQCAWLP